MTDKASIVGADAVGSGVAGSSSAESPSQRQSEVAITTSAAIALADQPTVYAADLADRICRQLSEGRTLRDICSNPSMPDRQTIRTWLVEDRNGFAARYKSAREMGYQAMADELLTIADHAVLPEQVPGARLRIDVRKWLLSVAMPKVYGDRVDVHATYKPRDTLREILKEIDGQTRGLPRPDERQTARDMLAARKLRGEE